MAQHFWDMFVIVRSLQFIRDAGDQPRKQENTAQAWSDILRWYIPSAEAASLGFCFDTTSVGLPSSITPRRRKRTHFGERFIKTDDGVPPRFDIQRFLWVDAFEQDFDVPQTWPKLFEDAVERLTNTEELGPAPRCFFILAVGLKWMPFLWDPGQATAKPMLVRNSVDGVESPIDPRFRPLREKRLPDWRHLSERGEDLLIDPSDAYTLDIWTKNQDGNLVNAASLELLERLLAVIESINTRINVQPQATGEGT